MSSFFTELAPIGQSQQPVSENDGKNRTTSRYCDFLQFLSIAFSEEQYRKVGLHPVITNSSPTFSDVSMGGVSFDIRKVSPKSFPHGLDDQIFSRRAFVVVKQPRFARDQSIQSNDLAEVAVELQILRHTRHIANSNIIELLGIVYHDANIEGAEPCIYPALVVEYAEYGNLRSYLARGFGRSIQEKVEICRDVARGLDHLHQSGIVHCDVKDTNMLVFASGEKKVVKVSDFGFAISHLDDTPLIVGYTRHWEAPELHDTLHPSQPCQLDIYSYGLLLYTVMKNGALFYQATQTEEQDDSHVLKLKTSNLLSTLLRMNLLLYMKNERCMLLIICNILTFCLQADPRKRFRSMQDILDLIRWCDPSDLLCENHPGQPYYQMRNVRSVDYQRYYSERRDRALRIFQLFFRDYQSALGVDTDLGRTLKTLYEDRFNDELDMFLIRQSGKTDDEIIKYCPGMTVMLFKSIIGVATLDAVGGRFQQFAERMERLNLSPTASASSIPKDIRKLYFCHDLNPDLPLYQKVLQKFPISVQRYIFMELEKHSKHVDDVERRRSALCNLAYCYIEGCGVEPSLQKGVQLLRNASEDGSRKARRYLVKIYAALGRLNGLAESTLAQWVPEIVRESEKRSLRFLQSVDQEAFACLKKGWAIDRSIASEEVAESHDENRTEMAISTCESLTWRARLLRFAAALSMSQLARQMILVEPLTVDSHNAYGQTPLNIAFQSGNFEIITALLECGADVGTKDVNGFAPLHWLISFSDVEKRKLALLLVGKNYDPHAYGKMPSGQLDNPAPNLRGGSLITGTPLHWAVANQDLVAVDILIQMGADASARPTVETRSALEMACGHHAAEIVQRMLEEPSTKATVSRYEPLGEGPISVNLMFWVVCGVSRFESLIRGGMEFEDKIEKTIACLVEEGVALDSVLQRFPSDPLSMSATFATAYNQCQAEVMRAGLRNGFEKYLDTTFAMGSSGGPAMSLAIAHKDREMFASLLDAGASITWRNIYKQSALSLAAMETDDVWFALRLLDKGAPVNDPGDPLSPFFAATYKGNLKVAKLLWDRGAKRESRNEMGLTILGYLIQARTRNAVRCIRFLMSLSDRDESDGFEVLYHAVTEHKSSALHIALNPENGKDVMSEDPEIMETSRLIVSLLLEKYSTAEYVNNTIGPHYDVPLGAAVEAGNHYVVRLLLDHGADPNAEDEYGRRPLDKLFWRYCYPATLAYLISAPSDDQNELKKRLTHVNQNTSEILSLLRSSNAQPSVFRFPSWHESDSGYRNVDWVMDRLREKRDTPQTVESNVPVWGNLPIRIPENPMQFEAQRRLAEHDPSGREGPKPPDPAI